MFLRCQEGIHRSELWTRDDCKKHGNCTSNKCVVRTHCNTPVATLHMLHYNMKWFQYTNSPGADCQYVVSEALHVQMCFDR